MAGDPVTRLKPPANPYRVPLRRFERLSALVVALSLAGALGVQILTPAPPAPACAAEQADPAGPCP